MISADGLLGLAVGVTVVHAVATGVGLIGTDTWLAVTGSVNVLLFLAGVVLFVFAFFVTAGRSREEDVWFGGAFLLSGGVAPPRHRRILLGCVGAQTLIGVLGAGLRPFSAMAFAVLPPLLGLALVAFYGARYAVFSPRTENSGADTSPEGSRFPDTDTGE